MGCTLYSTDHPCLTHILSLTKINISRHGRGQHDLDIRANTLTISVSYLEYPVFRKIIRKQDLQVTFNRNQPMGNMTLSCSCLGCYVITAD